MRKWMMGVTGLALAGLAVVPVFAQDEPGTIADIVVASTEADAPEFTTLLAAVSAADPAVLEALSDPEAELTVFAPTDAAFAALAETLGEEAFAGVLADQVALTDILLYHVLDGAVTSSDLVALLDAEAEATGSEDGATYIDVPTLNGQYLYIARDADGVITIDNNVLSLEMVDIEASNGVIHVVDAVLLPETRTVAEIVVASTEAEAPEFTTLLAAVGAADPAVLELLSDPEAEITVFAPTDAAFAALGEDTINSLLADPETLTAILQYHVIDGVVHKDQLAALLAENEGMLENEMANGTSAVVMLNEDGTITVDDATIVATDIDAANGVIHIIDAVLVPGE